MALHPSVNLTNASAYILAASRHLGANDFKAARNEMRDAIQQLERAIATTDDLQAADVR